MEKMGEMTSLVSLRGTRGDLICRHHGQDRDLLVGHDLQERGSIIVDQPFKGLNDLLRMGVPTALGAPGFGKPLDVGVDLVGMGITILVEEILPLSNHTLLLV
ncbi:unnamed protein product [Clonostachys rosea]|uniref:Uncharacterized protein n=1 Tax=Bionectria ochroleuca TaxID=29856 RepID=A0ABY6UUI3_BIOOC|nr:unnamed protein product [Clonostachys rosea]